MKQVTNLHTQPLALEDGTILAAAGTDGATKTVDSLGEADVRLVDRDLISVRDQGLKAVPAAAKPNVPAPRASEDASDKIAADDDAKREKQ